LQLRVKILVLLYLLPLASAVAEENFDAWYQIEIIVFKQKQVQSSDETWPLSDLRYPENMVYISPSDPQNLSPQTLGQLRDILAYEDLVFTNEEESSGSQATLPAGNFMFKSRSRKAPAISTIEKGEDLNNNDLNVSQDAELSLENDATNERLDSNQNIIDLDTLFDPSLPIAFRALEKSNHQLNGISRSINRSSLYELLLHQAWLQPVTSASTSKSILLQLGSHYDDSFEIDGTIKLSRSRFLHIDTDLWFTEFTSRYQQAFTPLTLDLPPTATKKYRNIVNWESNRGNYLPVHSHRLVHSRRMRRSTLHYIDHPRFGILVQVEKFVYDPEQ